MSFISRLAVLSKACVTDKTGFVILFPIYKDIAIEIIAPKIIIIVDILMSLFKSLNTSFSGIHTPIVYPFDKL
ncbi:hypothetical protein [Alkalithermobacter thermoalcaliphilus]|uniref:hypothetical protein n=1 Tax=Clostridium paradoxum TaxID=29346 RepID=UPI00128ED4E3